MKNFAIIEFSDGVYMVPSVWLTNRSKKCYWPKASTKLAVNKLIADLVAPDKNWELVDVVKIFGYADTYERAADKMKLCMDVSDIDTCISEASPIKKRKRSNQHVASDSEDDVIPSSQSLSPFPQTPTIRKSPQSSSSAYNKSEKTSSDSFIEFQKMVLQKLNKISRQMSMLQQKMDEREEKTGTEINLERFPLKSVGEIMELEEELKKGNNDLVNSLKHIGGTNENDATTRILRRVLTDEVAELFNWAGSKGKKAFKDLLITQAVFKTVKILCPGMTEKSTGLVIANWLKYAKQRKSRKDEKNKKEENESFTFS